MDFLYVSARLPRYTVGRDPGCDLVLPDPAVSRLHLLFEPVTPDVACLTVNGGMGAIVRGVHVGKGYKCHVRSGDTIRVGRKEFVWIGEGYEKTEFVRRTVKKTMPDHV
jgi:pSer/pThr/pTyr-binding forkhead associated (FHA) protein